MAGHSNPALTGYALPRSLATDSICQPENTSTCGEPRCRPRLGARGSKLYPPGFTRMVPMPDMIRATGTRQALVPRLTTFNGTTRTAFFAAMA